MVYPYNGTEVLTRCMGGIAEGEALPFLVLVGANALRHTYVKAFRTWNGKKVWKTSAFPASVTNPDAGVLGCGKGVSVL